MKHKPSYRSWTSQANRQNKRVPKESARIRVLLVYAFSGPMKVLNCKLSVPAGDMMQTCVGAVLAASVSRNSNELFSVVLEDLVLLVSHVLSVSPTPSASFMGFPEL